MISILRLHQSSIPSKTIQLTESHTTLPQQGPSSIVLPTIQNSPRKISQTTQLRRVELTNRKKNKSLQYFWAKKKVHGEKKTTALRGHLFWSTCVLKSKNSGTFSLTHGGFRDNMITNSNKAVVLGRILENYHTSASNLIPPRTGGF